MDFLKKHADKLNIYQQAVNMMGGSN
jgi:hypothetical protein